MKPPLSRSKKKVGMRSDWVVLACILLADHINCVSITEFDVPPIALEGDTVHLRCLYQDSGGSTLYTLRWYKDGQEFYRHLPGLSTPTLPSTHCLHPPTHQVKGVNVDCWNSTEREVVLKGVTVASSGVYQCEVIGEHPNFRKEVRNSTLTVYREALQPPTVSGAKASYSPLDRIHLNCTSPNTEYTPDLAFTINGNPVNESLVRTVGGGAVEVAFRAAPGLFERGVMTVRCISSWALTTPHSPHCTSTALTTSPPRSIT